MNFINNFFSGLNNLQKGLTLTIVVTVLFGLSAASSFSLFSKTSIIRQDYGDKSLANLPTASSALVEDPSAPRTESCPLNGQMHTVKAREAWALRRPLLVMVENHIESRPQSGLSSADVIYEAVAEGGITRFMPVYYCNLGDIQVGPVRSARTYFLDWLSEYDGLYAHVGGANTPGPANALGQIIDYKIKDLNQFGIGFPTFWRDYQRLGRPVATEHTMYSTTQKLWDIGAKKGWAATDSAGIRWDINFKPWQFKDDKASNNPQNIKVTFWQGRGDYVIDWNYDSSCNCYKRKNGGVDHVDLNTKGQLAAKNVVVRFQKEGRANDGYEGNAHLIYTNKGQGKALIFQDGGVIEGQWIKGSRLAREKFVDKAGKEISFNRGLIWLQTVPEGSEVKY